MTPSAFTKLGLRLLALHVGVFTALPIFIYWIPSATEAPLWIYAWQAMGLIAVALCLWIFADGIVDLVLPVRVSRDIPKDYPRLQGLALMFVGGLLVFDGLRLLTYPLLDAHVNAEWPTYIGLGLALFCEPVWRRRH